MIQRSGLPPNRMVLEITERSTARVELMVREAQRLRAYGFRLALDDVGAGNAGLEALRRIPTDFIKIDRSVVAEAMSDEGAMAVLAGIVAFARRARTFVIAEGIETAAMLDAICAASTPDSDIDGPIHGAQGYLLGRPAEVIAPAPVPAPTSIA
jgi:EAL domain-containing protein (putative c-di-GMP-specific phosphodiesterase class I)